MNKENRITCYQDAYMDDYEFEAVMVKYRQRHIVDMISSMRPAIVIEVGSGTDLLCQKVVDFDEFIDKWIIVEPSKHFAGFALNSNLPNLHVIHGFLEDSVNEVMELAGKAPDLVICSGVLHEVPNVTEFLCAVRSLLGTHSLAHINVPNANSLHRRLAKAMALVSDVKEMSDRNRRLAQYRVYDMHSLEQDVRSTGMSIDSMGGYLVKPFTHKQMERIAEIITDDMLDGLYRLGQELPEIASEIYVNARKSP